MSKLDIERVSAEKSQRLALPGLMGRKRRSQVRLCNIENGLPGLETFLDEALEVLGDPQSSQDIAQLTHESGSWSVRASRSIALSCWLVYLLCKRMLCFGDALPVTDPRLSAQECPAAKTIEQGSFVL